MDRGRRGGFRGGQRGNDDRTSFSNRP